MKLRAITLDNVRRFTRPVRIEGLSDGLNVLCEPNEHGKSTLFDALQALFFKPHRSKDSDVMSLRPHAGGAPEVTVEVETPEGRFVLSKRWLSRPMATVTRDGRLLAQADAAEDWIARLIGSGEGGPSGLVWVKQGVTGVTGLSGASAREEKATLAARRDLLSSVTGEVEAMTGGRRMDAALARCREDLRLYATATGKPYAQGPWREALERVEALRAETATLSGTAEALHAALIRRKTLRRALAELEAPEAMEGRRTRLEAAQKAYDTARRHAEAVAAATTRLEASRVAVTTARGRLDDLREAMGEHQQARDAAAEGKAQATAARGAHQTARAALDAAQTALARADQDRRAAAEALRHARLRQAAREGAARRAELTLRIAEAEAARETLEKAAAAARNGPDAGTLRRVETLASDLATARAVRDAAAPNLRVQYSAGRDGAIRIGDTPVPGDTAIPVADRLILTIEGIGQLELRPGEAGRDASVATAETALQTALDRLGAADLDDLRAAATARADAERSLSQAQAVMKGLAPEGIAPLRAALARIPEADDDGEPEDLEATETVLAGAEKTHAAAQSARDVAAARESDLRTAAARHEADAAGAVDRLRRAEALLDRAGGEAMQTELAAALEKALAACTSDETALAEQRRAAPDIAAAEAALARARSVEEEARAEIGRLRPEIAVLDERIAQGAGDAVEERLAETRDKLAAAEAQLERIEHEVAVLQRLESALETARAAARDRYFAPVAAELKPLLHLLWPESDLTWGQDSLLPESLRRDGQDEPIDVLSSGTQEQIALLVRLAFARMLARGGRHAPVILDDALVFTDDDRIERMFDALHRQAGDLQILVLTCRQRAFRDLGGRRLRLTEVAEG